MEKKYMAPKFTISSHINSYKSTLKPLCSSLIESGVPPESIYFFIGGYSTTRKIDCDLGINVYEVDHNSIDFTGLISVLDLEIVADFWFLLHDTVVVGPNFFKRVTEYEYNCDTIALTSDGPSMNIGCYSWKHLQSNKHRIMEFKNTDYTAQSLQKLKAKQVQQEDLFLKPTTCYFNSSRRTITGLVDYYNNGVLRRVEHYSDIDVTKIKANWAVKSVYELNV